MNVTQNGDSQTANCKTATAAKRYADPQNLIIECFEAKYSEEKPKYNFRKIGNLLGQETFVFVPGLSNRDDVLAWEESLEKSLRQQRDIITQTRFNLDGKSYWFTQSLFCDGSDLHMCEYTAPSSCLWCGSLFFNRLSRVWDNRHGRNEEHQTLTAWKSYCSTDCRIALNREKELSRRRDNRKVSRMTGFKSCEKCGSSFLPKKATAKFCSTKCRVYSSRQSRIGGAE